MRPETGDALAGRSPPPDLDPHAILAALGFPGAEVATRLTGGADAAIWRVERGEERFALRVLRREQAAMAQREAVAMRAAAVGGVPVPALHAAGVWRGRPALLFGWCRGRTLADELRRQPGRAWALGVAFGRAQAAIHAAPLPAGLDHPVPWLEWAAPDDALRACLSAVPPHPPALLHLDYHPLNVLVEGGRLVGVLDWANARVGDPRADLARTASILRLAPLAAGPAGAAEPLARRALTSGWRQGYGQTAGRVGEAELAPFLAWAGAVMLRDLAPRLGLPDLPWLTPEYLAGVERWTSAWRRRVGCGG